LVLPCFYLCLDAGSERRQNRKVPKKKKMGNKSKGGRRSHGVKGKFRGPLKRVPHISKESLPLGKKKNKCKLYKNRKLRKATKRG